MDEYLKTVLDRAGELALLEKAAEHFPSRAPVTARLLGALAAALAALLLPVTGAAQWMIL